MRILSLPCGCEELQVLPGGTAKNMNLAGLIPKHLGSCACVAFLTAGIDIQTQC